MTVHHGMGNRCRTVAAASLAICLSVVGVASAVTGRVIDRKSRAPLADAIVTQGKSSVRTLGDGTFRIEGGGDRVLARAAGYSRETATAGLAPLEIELEPFSPRAVHLSIAALQQPALFETVVGLGAGTQINALVIDVKNEQGERAKGLEPLLARLHREGVYTIARIAVFKDDALARRDPGLALRTDSGAVLEDNDGMAWTDPRDPRVWETNIPVAVEAARLGFAEIQLDFVRFPTVRTLGADLKRDEGGRRAAIRGFLASVREALVPYNVFVAADVFGYAPWDLSDTNVGQNLEEIAAEVDYVCLMLYPSAFKRGLPGARNPVGDPGRIVALSLERAGQRTKLPALRFRPWLQAFRDYNFDRRPFGRAEIAAQARAADLFGSNGWMLWHPRSIYAAEDLPPRPVRMTRAGS